MSAQPGPAEPSSSDAHALDRSQEQHGAVGGGLEAGVRAAVGTRPVDGLGTFLLTGSSVGIAEGLRSGATYVHLHLA